MRVLYAKNGGALAVEAEKEASFDFLFQHIEFRCGEELTEGDLKTITRPSQSFLIVTTPGFLLSSLRILLMVA